MCALLRMYLKYPSFIFPFIFNFCYYRRFHIMYNIADFKDKHKLAFSVLGVVLKVMSLY